MKTTMISTTITLLALTLSSVALADPNAPPRPSTAHVITSPTGALYGAPLAAGAKFSTKIPANLRAIALKNTSIAAPFKLNGVTQAGGTTWEITAVKGRGPGSQSQTLSIRPDGTIIDKSPINVEPKHTGTNSDL